MFVSQIIGIIVFSSLLSINKNIPDAGTLFQDFLNNIQGVNNRDMVLDGQYWRLLTAIFSHATIMHLFGNLISLVYIGSIIEYRLGKLTFFILYLLTGICASIVSLLFHYNGYALGASGAIFGLFGLFLALLCTDLYEKNARKAFFISTLIVVFINIIPYGKSDYIDHAAHFGGLISGFVLGFIAYAGIKIKHNYAGQISIVMAITIVLIFSAITLSFTDKYDLKEYERLKFDATRKLDQISDYFYDNENKYCTHTEKVAFLKKYALPKIALHRKKIKNITTLNLPQKLEKEADFTVAFVNNKLKMYENLYFEYKQPKNKTFREEINRLNQQILDLKANYSEDIQNQ